jgi:hypothetical protein
MPRTPRLTPSRARFLAFAGTAAALAGAGTAAAASASAAVTPHAAPVTSPAPGPGLGLGLTAAGAPLALTGTGPAAALTGTTPRPHAPAAWHGNYQMYDSVTPSAIPGGKAVATYADGPYAATPSQIHGHSSITWIDTNTTDPHGATALDVEPGDATPAQAATWTTQRLNYHPHATAIIYTMRSEWTATQTAIATLPHWMQHHVRYWIADPTGTPHIVPGSSATQWYWGTSYDISTATPNF